MQNRVQKKKKISLTTMIFIALLAGALAGVIINYLIPSNYVVDDIIVQGVFYIVGQGFIRLMRMLVVPLVFCSIVCGSMAVGDTKKLGSVGVKTLIFYLCTTALAITVALSIANIFNPGKGLDMSQIQVTSTVSETTQSMSMTETLLDIIPVNIFNSLSEGNMLQIIVFALILGVILANMGDRVDIVKNFFGQFNDIMMEMTMAVMKLAPIGVFCLIAKTFVEIGFEVFIPLLKYMFCVLLALAVQCFVVYLGLLKIFSGLNPFIFIKNFFPVMAFAFSTSTSNATIPMNIDTLAEKMGVSKKISSFTIPLGATINMDGTSIMQGVAVVFTAQAFGIPLDMMDYLTVIGTATLASIGTAGVPSVGLITLTMVFNSVGLPIEGIALIMGIDRILDMTRTAVNITGDAVCTTIVASWNKAVDRDVYYRRK
jgi:Na+/H+-dicarboxylate symporter